MVRGLVRRLDQAAYGILMAMMVGGDARLTHPRARQRAIASGFTIIETMVVLAVTGMLFVVVAATLSGRQNAAEFTHAIQSVQAQVQQTIDQVSAGFFPDQTNFTCTAGPNMVLIAAGPNTQGTNQDCVFLGKVMQFKVSGTDPEQYEVYTIAGLRNATAGPASPFATAGATVVGNNGVYNGYATTGMLEYGLTTQWVRANGVAVGAVGFLMEPGDLSSGGVSGFSSGSQQVDLIPIRPTALNQTMALAVAGIEDSESGAGGLRDPTLTASAPINPSGGVQICFASGGTNQSGLITIGGSGRQLIVKLDVKSNRTCS